MAILDQGQVGSGRVGSVGSGRSGRVGSSPFQVGLGREDYLEITSLANMEKHQCGIFDRSWDIGDPYGVRCAC